MRLRETAAQRHSVRTGFFVGETLEEESFDFRRDGMFKTLCFIVGLGPGQTDDVREQHFGELVTECHAFGNGAAFAREIDMAVASDRDEIIAAHTLERGSDGWRSYAKLFGQSRADWWLALFEELPDSFEVIFLGDAGF